MFVLLSRAYHHSELFAVEMDEGWDERFFDSYIVDLRRAVNKSAKFCCGKGQFSYGDVTIVNVP